MKKNLYPDPCKSIQQEKNLTNTKRAFNARK